MASQKYVYWRDGDAWLGYFEDFPDYWTQGDTEDELKANLLDLYRDLTSGEIPNLRRAAWLDVA